MPDMKWVYDDGGRKDSGFTGDTGDCVTRALTIVSQKPYKEVYRLVNEISLTERKSKLRSRKSSARTGVYKATTRRLAAFFDLKWVPCMDIGSGCTVHLRDGELPMGRLMVRVSRHCVAVIDGVIHDTHDPSREGTRCVYGYYILPYA